MRRIAGLLFFGLFVSSLWANEVEISAGSEAFLWQEFADNGDKYLDETGLRHFVDIRGTNAFHPVWSSSFAARFYSGVVDYDGQTQSGQPVTTDVDYNGMRFEIGMSSRIGTLAMQTDQSQWWLDFVVGNDFWRRHLRDSRLSDGTPVSGYTERYNSIYGRLGASYQHPRWTAGFGARFPFHTRETVRISGSDVELKPEGRLSLYAHGAYAFTPAWRLGLSYDSYRFAKSDQVASGSYLYHQPESTQDTLALAVHYRF